MTDVLFLHSSAGLYGADRQLVLLVRAAAAIGRPTAVLAQDGPLAGVLARAGARVLVRPALAVLRRADGLGPGLAARAAADARVLRRLRADLVHVNTSVVVAGGLLGLPWVQHVREDYSGRGRLWPAWRAALERADALVCVSAAVRAQLRRGVVVHDGVVANAPPAADPRAALGLPRGAFVVAVCGRIADWKGQELLAHATTGMERTVVAVAGDAWPGNEHLADGLRRHGHVRMLGFRDDVATVLAAADVVAVPSTRPDPLPNAALEAAAAGACVAAAAHGGLPEIVRDGVTGVLVAPGDPRAWRAALETLRADPARRRALGAAAAADVERRFAPERLASAITGVWRETRESYT